MSITYQRDWIVVDFNQNNRLENWLNDLAGKGYVVHTINFQQNGWIGDDSNHGHGGRFVRVGTIVAFKPTSVAITVQGELADG